jgi:hypothetical protein
MNLAMCQDIPDTVDIEICSTTLAKCVLHGSLLGGTRASIVEPVGINGAGGACKSPAVAHAGVGRVHNIELRSDLRISVESCSR